MRQKEKGQFKIDEKKPKERVMLHWHWNLLQTLIVPCMGKNYLF